MAYSGAKAAFVAIGETPPFAAGLSEQSGIPLFSGEKLFRELGSYDLIVAYVPPQSSMEGSREAEEFVGKLMEKAGRLILITGRSVVKQPGIKKPAWPTGSVLSRADETALSDMISGPDSNLIEHVISAMSDLIQQ